MRAFVSAIIPMHNEQENACATLTALGEAFEAQGWNYELIPVDDGSTDATAEELERLALLDARIRPVSYRMNRGRGYALRRGFAVAVGAYVTSLDADLSYCPDHAVRMVRTLMDDPDIDIVIASPYTDGGSVEGVPFSRLFISRLGNAVLSRTLPAKVRTSTGIARAYRREALDLLDLSSDGKEIHLEILSDAMALGFRIVEMPSTLRSRKKGHSKFRPGRTIQSHLLFVMSERSTSLFALVGSVMLLVGLGVGLYVLALMAFGQLNPARPLLTFLTLCFVGGTASLSFALLSIQLLELKRDAVRMQAQLRRIQRGGSFAQWETAAHGDTDERLTLADSAALQE